MVQGVLTPARTCCDSGAVDACGVCDGDATLCAARAAMRVCLSSGESSGAAADPEAAAVDAALPILCARRPPTLSQCCGLS